MLPMYIKAVDPEPGDIDLSPSPGAEYRVIKMEEDVRSALLNRYYKEVHQTMLQYQSYTLGLFPRGKSGHARVRDNVYCASALWAFSMAYRHVGDDKGRTHELEQSAVKCMRGILFCYMRQAEKVERFKIRQSWEDALHARFDCYTGDPVTSDDEWGHLQIDGTSLFLLTLAQLTASGVQVIYTMDEVDFIQNLVYYVERAYRTPDFGMWERGSRDNVGRRELHASSIGMTKSALEAMNGINLFGDQGSSLSIIHVDPDAQYRNCVILNNLLPRESTSKEADASLLCITGYPAFAIDDATLCKKTELKVKELLGPDGNHPTTFGFKRFQRDGHHTVKENPGKKYYDPAELTQYEGIECEWPLFYFVTVLTELCRGHQEEAEKYWRRLEKCLVENDGCWIVPRLYYIPESEFNDDITAGSLVTIRDCVYKFEPMIEEVPFQWAQALYLVTKLTRDGLITISDLDPLGLHLPHHSRHRGMARHLGFKAPGHDTVIQVALISETTRLQAILATHGIPTQTQKQVEPIKIRSPGDILMKVFHRIGENHKLGLSGRPQRPIGALGTSKVYRIFGQTVVFYPTDSLVDFYTSYDVMTLIDTFKSSLNFLNLYWNMNGKPTLCIYLTETRLKGSNFRQFVNFLAKVKQGQVGTIKVRLDRLQALISTSCIEHLEFGRDEDADRLLQHRLIAPLRSCSGAHLSSSSEGSTGSLMSMVTANMDTNDVFTVDDDQMQQLEEADTAVEMEPDFSPTDLKNSAMKEIKQRMKTCPSFTLGELYILHELMRRNETQFDIHMTIEDRLQEIYEYAGIRKLWKTLRLAAALLHKVVDSLAPALTSMLVRGKEVTIGVFGYPEHVISEPMTPKDLVKIIYDKCMPFNPTEAVLQQEIMIYLGNYVSSTYHNSAFDHMLRIRIGWIIQAMKNERSRVNDDGKSIQQLAPYEVKELLVQVLQDDDTRSPLNQRQLLGALNTVPPNFYIKVFGILEKTPGGIHARGKSLPQNPTILELVAHEKSFALSVEELFSNITFPEYRQMIIEALMVVSTVLERNPEVIISGSLDLDEILKDAMSFYQEDRERRSTDMSSESDSQQAYSTSYACHRGDSFYTLYPDGQYGSAAYITKAVVNKMLQAGLHYDPAKSCSIS